MVAAIDLDGELSAVRSIGHTAGVYEELIGRETPTHITKYDGSYHGRWPAQFVARQGPLYVLTCAPGDLVYDRGVPEDGADSWPLRWAGGR